MDLESDSDTAAGLPGGYDVDTCPSRIAIGMVADKWKLVILILLSRYNVRRFKELQRDLGSVSQKVLTSALRELEADGLVHRTIYAEIPPRVEYRITERTRTLLPILHQLDAWAERWYEIEKPRTGSPDAGDGRAAAASIDAAAS